MGCRRLAGCNRTTADDSEPIVKTNELVLLWKRKDGLRCVALKHAPTVENKTKLWELRVVRLSRVIKREAFEGFRSVMRAAQIWRTDFLVD